MNVPTYEKKDYSYLPTAFGQATKGLEGISGGITKALDIGTKERQKQQDIEKIKQLKIDKDGLEMARENVIAELAVEVRDALDLPDDETGRGRAADIAMTYYYPFYGSELSDPRMGGERLYKQEQNKDEYLNKLKMKYFREEFQKGTAGGEAVPKRIQEPVQGTVGVEDAGTIKKPLTTLPQNIQDVQQSVLQSKSELPERLEKIHGEGTAKDFWNFGVKLGITHMPEFKSLVGYLGRQETIEKEYPEKIYQGPVMREALSKPVVQEEGKEYAKTYEKEMTELEKARLENERLRAKRPYSSQVPGVKDLGTLLNYGQRLEESRRKIYGDIAKYESKLKDHSLFNRDETEQSVKEQLYNLDQQAADVDKLIADNTADITTARSKIGYPQPPTPTPTAPSPTPDIVSEAKKIANDLEKSMTTDAPNKKYRVETRYGKKTYSSGKKQKREYHTEEYQRLMAEKIIETAESRGKGPKPENREKAIASIAKALQTKTVAELIQRILEDVNK